MASLVTYRERTENECAVRKPRVPSRSIVCIGRDGLARCAVAAAPRRPRAALRRCGGMSANDLDAKREAGRRKARAPLGM